MADAGQLAGRLKFLFVLRSLKSLRYFQSSLELLAERGHTVRLMLEKRDHGSPEQAWLDSMLERPNFTCDFVDLTPDPWRQRRVSLQAGMEYVHFLGPEYGNHGRYMRKAERRSPPPTIKRVASWPLLRSPRGLRLVYGALAVAERALPGYPAPAAYIASVRPDVVALGDVGTRRSIDSIILRAARKAGIPTALCVASWDNLTTRGRLRVVPDRVVVWNETQRQEAVDFHRIPAARVAVTGAANFDEWFAWRPRPAEEFLTRVGLDPTKPVVLWVASALHNWERSEPPFVARWLEALRASEHESLRDVGVLVRPHPLRLPQWAGVELSDFGNVSVWPGAEMTMPVDAEQKADYHDSIFHSRAVVGINTSAMIEASIVGRPVLTFIEPEYHDSQLGALHFSRLLEIGGGALRLAGSLEEHIADLGALLAVAEARAPEATRRFVKTFVRPLGLDRPATPIFVDTLEQLGATPVAPQRDPVWVAPLRGAIEAGVVANTRLRANSSVRFVAIRLPRAVRKRVRRLRRR